MKVLEQSPGPLWRQRRLVLVSRGGHHSIFRPAETVESNLEFHFAHEAREHTGHPKGDHRPIPNSPRSRNTIAWTRLNCLHSSCLMPLKVLHIAKYFALYHLLLSVTSPGTRLYASRNPKSPSVR